MIVLRIYAMRSSRIDSSFRCVGRAAFRHKTLKVGGGVRRFARTSLRNQSPVNREIFTVLGVSDGSLKGRVTLESEVGRHFGSGETRMALHPNRERNWEGAGNDQGKKQTDAAEDAPIATRRR